MNLAQMRVAVRDQMMIGGGQNTITAIDQLFSDNEINAKLNMAQDFIYNAIRRSRQDYFTRILKTTDTVVPGGYVGQSFNPASLRWVVGQGEYQLPADFVRMQSITDITASSAADRIRITMSRIEREEFRIIMNESGGNDLIREYYGAIIGMRTLVIRPVPSITRDWMFIYEKKLPAMRDYTTGQLFVLNSGNVQVLFTASARTTERMAIGDELIVSDDPANNNTQNNPIPDPNFEYPKIAAFGVSNDVTLEGPFYVKDSTSLLNQNYIISSVSEIPRHHHDALVAFAVKELYKKSPNPSLEASQLHESTFQTLLQNLIDEVESRQGMDRETASAYLEDTYYGSWY